MTYCHSTCAFASFALWSWWLPGSLDFCGDNLGEWSEGREVRSMHADQIPCQI